MPASGQSYGLLSPPPETFQKRSQKSNSSVDSKSSYFSSVISHEEPSPRDSLFEGPSTALFISAALASPSCASNNESEYSTESQYLTPPEIDAGNEKPPYKARSPSAASLNMTASQSELITHPKHKYQGKQQHLQDEHTPSQKIQGHEQLSQEQGNNLQQGLPGHNERCPANAECEPESEPLVKSVRGPKRIIKNLTHIGDSSSFLFSAPATNITTRRWSSIGIGVHEPTQSDSLRFDPTCDVLANDSQERSNSWNHVPGNEDITRSLRARLTFRQIPPNHLSTPATITLRRASGVSLHNSEGLPTKPNPDFISPLLPQASQWTDTRPPAATYLITTDDVDFIVNLVQAGFDIRRTTVDTPDCNCVALRKPSVTGQGVIPQPGIPADLATTIADVHQILKIPRVSFKDPKLPDSKVKTGVTRKWSRSPSLQNVREVIWEETGSTGSHSISPKGSYMFDEGDEVMDNLSLAWLLGQSSSASHRINPPYAGFQRDDRSKNSDGDKSPTCHETFEELTEKMESSLQPFPNQSTFEQNPESTSEPFKKDSFSPISLFTPEVVSFPPLPARKCTTDWILPLPGISAPASDDDKSLHGTCIDAQGSKEQYGPLRHIGEPDVQEGAPERHHSSPNLDIGSQTKQKSAFLLHPQVSHGLGGPFKVGYALGCGPGARRKSSTQFMRLEISDKILEHHFHQDQTSWVKPRKDSGWPTPKSPPPEELDQSKSKMKHEGRIDLLKSLTPLLPEADHSGIYAAFTGTQKEKIMCEADCRQKHVCGNTPSDSRNPSTDWIG